MLPVAMATMPTTIVPIATRMKSSRQSTSVQPRSFIAVLVFSCSGLQQDAPMLTSANEARALV